MDRVEPLYMLDTNILSYMMDPQARVQRVYCEERFAALRGRIRGSAPVGVTFAGFNGESFDAKLWGVAQLRHRDFFATDMILEHPADKYGDAGAATGALLLALAAQSVSDGSRAGPALVWAASDFEPRACALLSTTG